MASSGPLQCPFCHFSDEESYVLMLHVETLHSEGQSPFEVREGPGEAIQLGGLPPEVDASEDYIECPEAECGESLLVSELELHADMHLAEKLTVEERDDEEDRGGGRRRRARKGKMESGQFDTRIPGALRNLGGSSSGGGDRVREQAGWRSFIMKPGPPSRGASQPAIRRLGRSELGPHAFEQQMPSWLRRQIEAGGTITVHNQINREDGTLVRVTSISNETPDLIPVLAQLLEQDPSVEYAYLCHPGLRHISKMSREGGFCGYRNIQMLISYMREVRGYECFDEKIPNILRLQDMIEEAWDRGFNSSGRVETGGIRGTRKYIGTPEAQALLMSLEIPCEAKAFGQGASRTSPQARLLSAIESYFSLSSQHVAKVHQTDRPPIYFQHPGHSLTIAGLERRTSGRTNLLVFDPIFKPSPAMLRLLRKRFRHGRPGELLKAYRRGGEYLGRYHSFETVQLT